MHFHYIFTKPIVFDKMLSGNTTKWYFGQKTMTKT